MTLAAIGGVLCLIGAFRPEPMNGFSVVGLILVGVGVFFHVLIVEPAQEMVDQINRELDREQE